VLSEKFLALLFWQNVCAPELLKKAVQSRPFVQQERACGVEWGDWKRRSAFVAGKGTAFTKSVMERRSSAQAYWTGGARPASAAACMQLK
jgi:hypothetical protein